MNSVSVAPCRLEGCVSMPPSKSASHRAVICAALASGKSTLRPVALSDDIAATISCMRELGADITVNGDTVTVDGTALHDSLHNKKITLDCGESGSTLRFLIPVAAALGADARFIGHGRLPQRPIGVFSDCLPEKGVSFSAKGGLPLDISGRLQSGIYRVPGNISSQFITGLLLALPLLEGDSEIILTSELQSAGYIDMTTDIMRVFGVSVCRTSEGWKIKGGQSYCARSYEIEGDWSQAAFFMTAAALGGCITIDNLDVSSCQGDKACMEIYSRFGASVTENPSGSITISGGSLHGIDIDAENIPDMVPALAVTAALCEGVTRITGAERLRIKECDRLAAMTDALTRLGADIRETPDGLIIKGVKTLHGGSVEGCNDHRIVMSMTAASCRCDGSIVISDMESINKSYPSFFEDIEKLGGKYNVIMG